MLLKRMGQCEMIIGFSSRGPGLNQALIASRADSSAVCQVSVLSWLLSTDLSSAWWIGLVIVSGLSRKLKIAKSAVPQVIRSSS